ncbi:MAG TPA: choice-of-anchor E domain-containing protein [Roseateles sp.]
MSNTILHRLARTGLALTAALSCLAHAGLVSYSTSVSTFGRDTDTRGSLSYERFDASLGVLREVRFTFDLRTDYSMGFSNLDDHAREISIRYGTLVEFGMPQRWWDGAEQWDRLEVAGGVLESFIQRSWTSQQSFSLTDNLARFVSDTPGWMDYRLHHHADGFWDDWSYLGFGAVSTTRVDLRMDYLYDEASSPSQPLPEPGALALALAACAAAGVGRRSLRKRGA